MINEESINVIKKWLGTGSINIFGLPYSGKDTVGIRLAEMLNGRFLSSGLILREAEKEDSELRLELSKGFLASQDKFRDIVLPYFYREDIAQYPLILSSVGRWSGEETSVTNAATESGHEIKAAILLNVSEADIENRWREAGVVQDRGQRADDKEKNVLAVRVDEFRKKTMPVVEYYRQKGLLISVLADQSKDAVFGSLLQKLLAFIEKENLAI